MHTGPHQQLNQAMDEITRQCLRGKCCELAVHLIHGDTPPMLLAEVEELAVESWAFREFDDA